MPEVMTSHQPWPNNLAILILTHHPLASTGMGFGPKTCFFPKILTRVQGHGMFQIIPSLKSSHGDITGDGTSRESIQSSTFIITRCSGFGAGHAASVNLGHLQLPVHTTTPCSGSWMFIGSVA